MYRKLIGVPVLAFAALAVALAATGAPAVAVGGFYGRLGGWLPANAAGNLRVGAAYFLTGLVPLLLGIGLTWLAAFHPGRRAGAPLALLKYAAVIVVAAQAVMHIWYRAGGVATAARALGAQTGRPLPLVLLGGGFLHALVEIVALAMVLTAPLYWLVRGAQVGDFRRATYEAWAEVRRLVSLSLTVLIIAAALNVWATPVLATMLVR